MRFVTTVKINMTDEKGEEEKMKNQIVSKAVNLILELDYCNKEELKQIDDMFRDIAEIYHTVDLDDYENKPLPSEAKKALDALAKLTNRVYKK